MGDQVLKVLYIRANSFCWSHVLITQFVKFENIWLANVFFINSIIKFILSKQRRVCHCSLNSASRAPIKRNADSSLGKIRTTRSQRLISSLSRSCMFVVRNVLGYLSGGTIIVIASSKASSRQLTALGTLPSKSWINGLSRCLASFISGACKNNFTLPATVLRWRSAQKLNIFYTKRTWHRCQVAPRQCFFAALWWSDITYITPVKPRSLSHRKVFSHLA